MALTKTVTRVFPNANYVGLHLLLEDDGKTIIDKDYMEQWDDSLKKIPSKVQGTITRRMQTDIDAYKELKTRFDDPGDNAVVSEVNAALKL